MSNSNLNALGMRFDNPIIRRISKIDEMDAVHVTYQGVAAKLFYFMWTVIAGMALCMILEHVGVIQGLEDIDADGVVIYLSKVTMPLLMGLAISFICFVITPILAVLIRVTIPVTGTLYCVSAGYIVTFLGTILEEYRAPIMIALILTVMLFFSLGALYSTGKIRVSDKFRAGFGAFFLTIVFGSLILFIMNFIPALSFIPQYIYGNTLIGLLFSIIGVGIACVFVVIDFSVIQESVDNQLPVKYEWSCAFGLAFSFIYLYFKILDLILRIMNKAKN